VRVLVRRNNECTLPKSSIAPAKMMVGRRSGCLLGFGDFSGVNSLLNFGGRVPYTGVCVFPLPRHWFYLGQNLLVHQSLTSKHQVHRPEGLIEEPLSEVGILAGF